MTRISSYELLTAKKGSHAMKPRLSSIVLLLGLSAISGFAQVPNPLFGDAIDPVCFKSANYQVTVWRSQGKTPDQVEKLYQQALAECSGVAPSMAAFVATVNFDLARFARLYSSGNISSSLYLALSRDRGRKLRRVQKDPVLLQVWLQGDEDSDLVPNGRDACPGTPDRTPTTDNGCPSTAPLPPGPPPELIKRAMASMGFMIDTSCAEAPMPGVAQPVKAGYEFPFPAFLIGVMHANNQPQDCLVAYEIQIRFRGRKDNSVPPEAILGAVFNRTENTNHSSSGATFQIFRINSTATGPRKRIYDTATHYTNKEIRVRVMNGAGITSGWSTAIAYNQPYWQQPQVH